MSLLNVGIATDSEHGTESSELSTLTSPGQPSPLRFGRIDRLLAQQPAVQAIRDDARAVVQGAYAAAAAVPPMCALGHRDGDLQERVVQLEDAMQQLVGAHGTLDNLFGSLRAVHENVNNLCDEHESQRRAEGQSDSRHSTRSVSLRAWICISCLS